jgi:2-oxo-4-hydroxy-4-carboxy--5-ureidoimidazoline (OHCU) decarboxylase
LFFETLAALATALAAAFAASALDDVAAAFPDLADLCADAGRETGHIQSFLAVE